MSAFASNNLQSSDFLNPNALGPAVPPSAPANDNAPPRRQKEISKQSECRLDLLHPTVKKPRGLRGATPPTTPLAPGKAKKTFHRIAEVRKQQGDSLRSISRKTGIEVRELKRQELPNEDLRLSDLYLWQKAMEVPIAELLSDDQNPLSPDVRDRARLVKVMKTVAALSEVSTNPRVSRMVEMLREQLLEIMPELREVVGWPSVGSRRPTQSVGKIAQRPISLREIHFESNED